VLLDRLTLSAARDRSLLSVAVFVRAVTIGFLGVTIGVYLARVGFAPETIGAVISAGFAGGATAATVATVFGDRVGRRRMLLLTTLLSAAGTVVVAVVQSPVAMAAGAFMGMLNGMGKDRGAALILEQAALPGTTTAEGRTRAIAVYTMLQDIGHASGALLAAAPAWLAASFALPAASAQRGGILASAAAMLALAGVYLRLGPSVDAAGNSRQAPLRPETRRILVRISSLFAIDSLAGGFLTTALLSYFFFERFHVGEDVISEPPGWPAASGSSIRWYSRTSHRACCSSPSHSRRAFPWPPACFSFARASSRWTCPPGSRTCWPSSHPRKGRWPRASQTSYAWPAGRWLRRLRAG
jgi:MFS family permease